MNNTLNDIKNIFTMEAEALLSVRDKVDKNFVKAVDLISSSNGKVVISGIGKSGLIGRKISATLNSTGTYSIFLHPVEAMHGDRSAGKPLFQHLYQLQYPIALQGLNPYSR